MRDARGQLTQRGHLLRLDQVGLGGSQVAEGGLDRASGFLRGIAGRGDLGFVAFPFRDVGEDQHEPAARHGVVADLDHPAIGTRSFIRMILASGFGEAAKLFLRVNPRAKVAAGGEVTDVVGVTPVFFQKCNGYCEDFLKLVVPGDKARGLVEHGDAIAHVLEGDTQFGLAPRKFIGAGA